MDHFPLLALPRELRDWIYDCTLNALGICVQAVELTTPSGDDPEDCPTDRDDGVALSKYTRSIFKPTPRVRGKDHLVCRLVIASF